MTLTRTCPTCEAALAADSQYCDQCDQEFCPDCLVPIASDATACPACGAEFDVLCPACDAAVDPAATRCPACGYAFTEAAEVISGRAMAAQATLTEAGLRGELEQEELTDAECPACGAGIVKVDGFCSACGTPYCPSCAREIGDDDETCPHCSLAIFFDCPLCGFELTTGTDLCPECHALFYMICPNCDQPVEPLEERCASCHAELTIVQRQTGRVIHTVVVGDRLVRMFACTRCGEQFDSRTGVCPACALTLCVNCLLILEEGEEICPRCRPDLLGSALSEAENDSEKAVFPANCPTCRKTIAPHSDQCPHCEQLLCPDCGAAVAETDETCAACGAVFELVCPACDALVTAEDEICPACGLAI